MLDGRRGQTNHLQWWAGAWPPSIAAAVSARAAHCARGGRRQAGCKPPIADTRENQLKPSKKHGNEEFIKTPFTQDVHYPVNLVKTIMFGNVR